jgi:trehalose 6-phosphate phosphatase
VAALPPALAPLVADPTGAGLFTDFDGTLAPIVDEPEQAVPLAGTVEVLGTLATRLGRVGVISGRPVTFLDTWFTGSTVALSGLYGLQSVVDGERRDDERAGAWSQVVDDVVAAAAASGPPGMKVEHKGLSVTLHYREHPDAADPVRAWAERQAARSGLEVRRARMSIELHPPLGLDKGRVLTDLAGSLHGVCFLGDDVGDLPAFAALDRMRAEGRTVAKVVVRSPELAPEVEDAADVIVDGPEGALSLLRGLVAALDAA